MKHILSFTLNGTAVDVLVKPTDTLLDVIREDIGITGTKRGCDSGDCGACTVLLNNEPVNACLTIALTIAGKEITTVDPLQKSFYEHGASQCGFCTPGMLISAKALLEKVPNPSRDEIVEHMSGNLCRCGTYLEVIEAIQSVSSEK